jgi:hypothetical protein
LSLGVFSQCLLVSRIMATDKDVSENSTKPTTEFVNIAVHVYAFHEKGVQMFLHLRVEWFQGAALGKAMTV